MAIIIPERIIYMKIESTSYDPYLTEIAQSMHLVQQPTQTGGNEEEADIYVSSITSSGIPIPSQSYNASGMMVGDMAAVNATNTDSKTNAESDFMKQLSEAFRANEDSIEMTLDDLGFTLEDLSDEENLKTFAYAMNERAASLGLPQVENLGEIIQNLQNAFSDSGTGDESADTAESTQNTIGSGESGGGGEDSSDDTTTQIVTVDGVTYLETTTTENGTTTTTRTKLGESIEV